jgi:hypothetical protein
MGEFLGFRGVVLYVSAWCMARIKRDSYNVAPLCLVVVLAEFTLVLLPHLVVADAIRGDSALPFRIRIDVTRGPFYILISFIQTP